MGELHKSVLHTVGGLGACLEVQLAPQGFFQLLDALHCGPPQVILQVTLIPDQHQLAALSLILLYLLEPEIPDVSEGGGLGQVIHDNNGIRTLVIRRYDAPEALLAGRIPNLQLYSAVIDWKGAEAEVDSYRSQ